ncbi:hypothetical protein JYB87_11960 [Shewanella avicenniae]|uniref:Uncharacterized protein n=1 Tax=Shewanella avicenniae TaxID=2814294 RepID=A0ABX7QP16_9GAMM|nr:hypothetical protein [Shewanella avicenniae]QSX32480.1 hypothetical protein JYB87_11960 [Shewanella avicenniae]
MKTYYGLQYQADALVMAKNICAVLGFGKYGTASEMIVETACAETQLGTYKDTTPNNGHGLCQHDKIGIVDVQERTKDDAKAAIKDVFGYDIELTKPEDLDSDPKLSLIFCRLTYRLRPEHIPSTYLNRAHYWKSFYNKTGAGTPEHYIESVERWLTDPEVITFKGERRHV